MVYRAISNDLKGRALWLLEAGFITDDVVDLLGVSRASLYRWKANELNYDSVTPPHNPLQGRPRILNPDQTHDLLTLLAEAPEMYLDEITDWVAVLRRAATERDDVARAEWKLLIQTAFVSSMIVTADESSKDERTIFRKRGRAPSGRGNEDPRRSSGYWTDPLGQHTVGRARSAAAEYDGEP
ncbi:hypothetical protein C8R47DRAFT_1198643 [Mycena vitilis]|nr:hypothetical protein C8R47DRAFT_1198643 [Mycena vitilis]